MGSLSSSTIRPVNEKPKIVVIGGSYVGCKLVDCLLPLVKRTHTIVLVEPHSHFQHLFAFPRIAVVPGFEERAFVPFDRAFVKAGGDATNVTVIKARALEVLPVDGEARIPGGF
jgi:NADH dehydrogenase FAD-containing subunit